MGKIAKTLTGTAVAASVAAAVVVFFTSTKKGQETSKKIKEHATELGKKISEELDKSKVFSKKKYEETVDKVVEEYGADKKLAQSVLNLIKKDLKKRWGDVEKHTKPITKTRKNKKNTKK